MLKSSTSKRYFSMACPPLIKVVVMCFFYHHITATLISGQDAFILLLKHFIENYTQGISFLISFKIATRASTVSSPVGLMKRAGKRNP